MNDPARTHRSGFRKPLSFSATVRLLVCFPGAALAGPPFTTDDPEPVTYRHWEFYVASQNTKSADGWSGTAPHFEVNYGAISNLQLHLIAPLAYDAPAQGTRQYGYGDTEVGVKYRFIQETDVSPQVGLFPLLEIPTGSAHRGVEGMLTHQQGTGGPPKRIIRAKRLGCSLNQAPSWSKAPIIQGRVLPHS
jgi:hypothetical protein